ncbi:META domain-containing protein [Castellaniella sp.]|uniref:META domain-containing protein n=1 Tax=Castellaniella sp. TaxID=1955812 RepID=UPI002B001853|nr:META domain-containing protein [Castellaniella sp.]
MHRHFAISHAIPTAARTNLRPLLAAGALTALWSFSLLITPALAGNGPMNSPTQASPDATVTSEKTHVEATPVGSWLLEDIRGGGVIDRVRTEMTLESDGRISGSGGCNRIMGQGKLDGETLTIGPLAGTRMACPPAVMEQEDRFLKTLEEVKGWRVETEQQKLHLLDGAGETLLIFSATTPQK